MCGHSYTFLMYLHNTFYMADQHTKAITLGLDPPAPDFTRWLEQHELWLYLGVEFRRRRIALPDYMESIADFSTLEAGIKKWEREKEVAHWQDWFATHEPSVAPTADTLDLRLAFLVRERGASIRMRPF